MADRSLSTVKPSRFRSRPPTKPKPIGTGTRSSETGPGERVRVVQGPMGTVVTDSAGRADERHHRSRSRCGQTGVRCDDGDAKDRHCCNRGGASRAPHPRRARDQRNRCFGGVLRGCFDPVNLGVGRGAVAALAASLDDNQHAACPLRRGRRPGDAGQSRACACTNRPSQGVGCGINNELLSKQRLSCRTVTG